MRSIGLAIPHHCDRHRQLSDSNTRPNSHLPNGVMPWTDVGFEFVDYALVSSA